MQDAAVAIILTNDDQVLWVKRSDLPIWVLPGGGIEPCESPEEAVIREVQEECGLKVEIVNKAAHYSPTNRWTRHTHIFICKPLNLGILSSTTEASEIAFFPPTIFPSPYFPLHEDWLKEALNHRNRCISRPMYEFTWKRVAKFFLKHPLILVRYLFFRFLRVFGCVLMLLSQLF